MISLRQLLKDGDIKTDRKYLDYVTKPRELTALPLISKFLSKCSGNYMSTMELGQRCQCESFNYFMVLNAWGPRPLVPKPLCY